MIKNPYIQLLRPFTLLAPFIGGAAGGLLAVIYHDDSFGISSLVSLILGGLSLSFLNAASNVLNQVTDLEIDKINKPERAIPSGRVSIKNALIFACMVYGISTAAALLVNMVFFTLFILLVAFTVLYSVKPFILKKRLWISNISIGISRGLIGFLASWTIFGNVFEPLPWLIGGMMALYLFGASTTKDFTDIPGDRKFGMNTLPVVYGIKKSINIIIPFFFLPFLIIPAGILMGYFKLSSVAVFLILITWGLFVARKLDSISCMSSEKLENNPLWAHMYFMLIFMQVSFIPVYALM